MAWPPRNKEATMAGPTNQRDWAFLIPDIIDIILEKLTDSFTGFLHFISVCQRWRLLALEKDDKESDNMKKLEILRTCRNQLPLLVTESLFANNPNRWFFTNIQSSSDGSSGYQPKKQLDRPGDYSYCGSSFGWLIGRQEPLPISKIVLFNPLSSAVKILPLPNNQQRIADCDKAVLSSDPEGDYELVVIHKRRTRLACYRSTTKSWMHMRVGVVDAVFYGGKICAITDMGNLLHVNFDTGHTQVVVHWNQPCYTYHEMTPYLVVSNEGHDLLMVKQRGLEEFEVLKLCFCEAGEVWTWVEINNLGGDQALFVGCKCYNHSSCFSACVSTLEFPQCQPNCIYYNWGHRYPGHEQRGVFNMELKQHFESPLICTAAGPSSSQFWMVPNLKGS